MLIKKAGNKQLCYSSHLFNVDLHVFLTRTLISYHIIRTFICLHIFIILNVTMHTFIALITTSK